MNMMKENFKSGISSEALKPLAGVMYVAGINSKNDNLMKKVGSTVLNRLESLDPIYGAENGLISDVINKGYAESQSPLYQKFLMGEFDDKKQETVAKKAILFASGLVRKSIPRDTEEFFFSEDGNTQGKKTTKEDLKFSKSNSNSGNKPGKTIALNKVGKLAGKR